MGIQRRLAIDPSPDDADAAEVRERTDQPQKQTAKDAAFQGTEDRSGLHERILSTVGDAPDGRARRALGLRGASQGVPTALPAESARR